MLFNTHIQTKKHGYFYALLLAIFTLVLLTVSFKSNATSDFSELKKQQVDEILFNIHAYYVEDIAIQEKVGFSPTPDKLAALFEDLDPYSKYLNKSELDAIFDNTNGRYKGLGIEVQQHEQHFYVLNALANSPAKHAGLQKDDQLISINHQQVTGKTLEQLAQLIHANDSGKVVVTILRGEKQQLNFTILLSEIELETVTSYLSDGGIGLIAINGFNNNTYGDVAKHIAQMQSNYGYALNGLIIDLRDNPGGTLKSAVEISDLFLNSGTIVTTKGRAYNATQTYSAKQGDILDNAPIAVLINNNSASAAEILAAALADNKRAIILGSQSFGKGSVQSLIPLGNGNTALKLTTARYYTPSGKTIEGVGVNPDVPINQSMLSEINQEVIIKNVQQLNLFKPSANDQTNNRLAVRQIASLN